MRRTTSDHRSKQLLSVLMEYADPDIDQITARCSRLEARHEAMKRLFAQMDSLPRFPQVRDRVALSVAMERRTELWREVERLKKEQEEDNYFPATITDAINILRNVKIGRDGYDGEKWDPIAKAVAEGVRDKEKQDSLYVRVGRTGAVCNRPKETDCEAIKAAVERSQRLRSFLARLLEYGGFGIELKRLKRNLEIMFADQEVLKIMFPD
jgi:hypothetical protein